MKRFSLNTKGLFTAALIAGLSLANGSAWAGSKIQAIGGAARVNGAYETNANGNRDPWVAQVFTSGNECLRIAVISQGTDLEATLVSTTGRTWQDDDSGGSLRPLIKAITDARGWYPLILSHFNGAVANADFTMDITRLPSNSPLCAPATSPSILFGPDRKPVGGSFDQKPGGAN
jgi:hypothetical protein